MLPCLLLCWLLRVSVIPSLKLSHDLDLAQSVDLPSQPPVRQQSPTRRHHYLARRESHPAVVRANFVLPSFPLPLVNAPDPKLLVVFSCPLQPRVDGVFL